MYEIRDAELMDELARRVKADGIENAAIVSLIGAVDEFTVTTMAANDALDDQPLTMSAPAEMSGTGEVTAGHVHVHASMAVEGGHVVGGHLISARVRTHFARVYLAVAN
jgi:predicted DNA-binding protein with PD1-like motif